MNINNNKSYIVLYFKLITLFVFMLILTSCKEDITSTNTTPHLVTYDTAKFSIERYAVTNKQWDAVMRGNVNGISFTKDNIDTTNGYLDDVYIAEVSWYDVLVFCNRLSIKERMVPVYSIFGHTNPDDWGAVPTNVNKYTIWNDVVCNLQSNGYRLPTVIEWDYLSNKFEIQSRRYIVYDWCYDNQYLIKGGQCCIVKGSGDGRIGNYQSSISAFNKNYNIGFRICKNK